MYHIHIQNIHDNLQYQRNVKNKSALSLSKVELWSNLILKKILDKNKRNSLFHCVHEPFTSVSILLVPKNANSVENVKDN